MPYGQGQMLGAGVDPRMFVQDYSGFTRAAEIQAQGMQNLGAAIGQGIKDYGEIVGERKKTDAQIKADDVSIESAIKLGDSLGIDIKSYLEPIQALRKDPNTTPAQSLALGRAAAQGISNAFTLGIGAQNRAIKLRESQIDAAYKQANLDIAQQRADIYGQKAQAEVSKLTKGTLSFFDPETNQSEEMDVNYDIQGRPRVIGTGELIVDPVKFKYGEGGVEKLPETSQVGGISDSIAKVAQMNIGRLSTAKTPGTQGGNLGCADAVCKIYNQATGEELVQGGTLSTSKMIESLSNDPRFQSIPINQARAGDIIVTPRGKRAGHTGIFVSDNEIASNSSKGFRGGQRGTLEQNYSKGSWMSSVDARNPGTTQVFRRIEEAAPSQMAGTPEQQAEIARQIEQGAGMATAQAGRAMPTEPSLAQQQPQPPARRQVVATRPVRGGEKGTIMTQEQVAQIERSGKRVSGVPTADGNFMVTSVSTAAQPPRNIKTPQEELQTKRLLTIDEEQSKMRAAGVSDAQNVSKFNELLGMLDTGTKTGFGREFLMKAKKVVGGNVADEEDFIARTGEIAMTNIDLTKGAISDREMEYFRTDLSPNIGKTVEGNKRVIQFKLKYAQRSAKIAKTISEMQKQNASPFDIQTKIDEILASDSLVPTGGGEGGSVNQAESDASFIRGFQGAD